MTFTNAPVPVFRHLNRLTDERGLVEHADGVTPRPADGYSVDVAALGLVVVCREPRPAPNVNGLARLYLDFVLSAVQPDGTSRGRMSAEGLWTDEPGLGDCWGRAVWGLGAAATLAPTSHLRVSALAGFHRAAKQRSPHPRAMAFAALGAAEVLTGLPGDAAALDLLRDAVDLLTEPEPTGDSPWPEPGLAHDNGVLAEAVLRAGDVLEDDDAYSRGLEMLDYLLGAQTVDGHLSVTPSDDGTQRPLEIAGIADACASAFRVTRERRWLDGVDLSWRWFLGDNDGASVMFDPSTGGGFDGLGADGPVADQGAAATLAALSTAQHARRLFSKK